MPAFTENAQKILNKRYLRQGPLTEDLNGEYGPIETAEQMYHRVAKALASVEPEAARAGWEVEFYRVMNNWQFTPAGRTLTNAGADTPVVSNCIVLHFDDSMSGIFQTLKDAAELQQLGSGLGFAWHLLRPAGWRAKRSGGVASGPVSFMKVYDQAFGVIKQQGRHGANMGVMRVDHPDILEFIHCKEKEGAIKNFNISVGLTDAFMEAVRSNNTGPWMCEWKGQKMLPRVITRDSYDTIVKVEPVEMTAKELFQEIIGAAWTNGEPGCVFLDAVNKTNPLPGLGRLETCNPCGEQFLHDGDVCNLGSINLAQFVVEGAVNWNELEAVTSTAVRMLDNTIDITTYPVARVKQAMVNNRRVGLGVMGWADMLYQLGVPYDSEEACDLAKRVMSTIQAAAVDTSITLAELKGSFPNHDKSIFRSPRRNAALTSIAPTGSISMLWDASSGIEPAFALTYYKGQVMGGQELFYSNQYFEAELRRRGLYSDELMKQVALEGSIHNTDLPEDMKRVFVTAHDISPEWHMRMQAAWQQHVDNSISKTVNFPHEATPEDIQKAYVSAWELGCKGMTVYRDGSRQTEVLYVKHKDPAKKQQEEEEKCTSCGAQMRIEEGCANCPSCGNSLCKL